MKLPLSWLKDYMNTDGIDNASYIHALTMSGSMVEGIENPAEEFENVVTGKIQTIEKHPDADKLVVCQVDVGENDPIQIVTGAKNVFAGAVVPVAKHKSRLPGGVKITKGKLRGIPSYGMMCSTDELGLSEERATGILILPDDTPIGEDITKVLGLDESVAEFEITSNRPDCMSVIGLARETAATFNRPFSIPEDPLNENSEDVHDYASVEVEDSTLCPRYVARVVKNVKIGPSPEWMQRRLKACGLRAINNVVDITNYIMLEYGQPMHAYDLAHVEGKKIIVRRAQEGEQLETLDDQPRTLSSSMIAIGDAARAIGVAGVMGGANSEVTENTTTILFESANFQPILVRRAARALNMRTDASALFEKGLDPENCLPAINHACRLLLEMGTGELVGGVIDVYPQKKEPTVLPFEPEKMNRFLGTNISEEEMLDIFHRLEFSVKDGKVIAPTFRGDIESMADLAEEIARIYGYDKIPSTMMRGTVVAGGKTKKQKLEDKIKDLLSYAGMYEIMTYSFIDPKENQLVGIPEGDPRNTFVRITNPLGEENSVMRTDMVSSMLKTLRTNYNRRNAEAALFELGTVYQKTEDGKLPDEQQMLSMGMYGSGDFYTLKGLIEELLDALQIQTYRFVPCKDNPTFHPGRCADLYLGKEKAGTIGQIHPVVATNFKMDTEVYAASLAFDMLLKYFSTDRTYRALPKFPATSRDIALLIDKTTPVGAIADIIEKQKTNIVEEYHLFDVYEGEQVGEGKKSVAYSISFRAVDRTLTDEEVNAVMEKILQALKQELQAELR